MQLESAVFWTGAILVYGYAIGWLIEGFGFTETQSNFWELVFTVLTTLIAFMASGWPFVTVLVIPSAILGMLSWKAFNIKDFRHTKLNRILARDFSLLLILFIPLTGVIPVLWLKQDWSLLTLVQLGFCLVLAFKLYGNWEESFPKLQTHLQHALAVVTLGLGLLFFPVLFAVISIF